METNRTLLTLVLCTTLALLAPVARAHEPSYTTTFDREACTFSSTGSTYFPLWPGHTVVLEGEEDDEGELIAIGVRVTVLGETELVDGVETRVVEEYETEDDEVVEISRNFFAVCRQTGDLWYFGEDVDIYEDGEVVSHDGAWRAGVDGATPGLFIPGSLLVGARFMQEVAPGVAEDRSEIIAIGDEIVLPAGTFDDLLTIHDTNALNPSAPPDLKVYAPGIGLVVDEELELVEYELAPCVPDATTHCLADGRFRVTVEWEDFAHDEGPGQAILGSTDSGEFWFFAPTNTELIVKVLDACAPPFNAYWVFAAGLTNVDVTITVVDTATDDTRIYTNPLGAPFAPVLDTGAFETCP